MINARPACRLAERRQDELYQRLQLRFEIMTKYTRRFQPAREIAETTCQLLLMTATPHNGKEEDFQLFLSRLDIDRFEGRPWADAPA